MAKKSNNIKFNFAPLSPKNPFPGTKPVEKMAFWNGQDKKLETRKHAAGKNKQNTHNEKAAKLGAITAVGLAVYDIHASKELNKKLRKIDRYQIPVWIIKLIRQFYGLSLYDMDLLLTLGRGTWAALERGRKQDRSMKVRIMQAPKEAFMKTNIVAHIKRMKNSKDRSWNQVKRLQRFTATLKRIEQGEKFYNFKKLIIK